MSKNETGMLDLLKHLGLAVIAFVLVVVFVFYIYLPFKTNHGESLTVPSMEGIMLGELGEFLEDRDLRYEIAPDSGFSAKYPPLAVLKQFPLAGAKVKEGRKIYLTLNATKPPVVKLPAGMLDRSLKNAQLELRSMGLALGEVSYKAGVGLNTIAEMSFKGKIIREGDEIPKGSKIDFVVRDGLGNQTFVMFDIADVALDEAIFLMKGYGLKVGEVFYEKNGVYTKEVEQSDGEILVDKIDVGGGKVFKFSPGANRKVKIGQEIDLWVVELDSATLNVAPVLNDVAN